MKQWGISYEAETQEQLIGHRGPFKEKLFKKFKMPKHYRVLEKFDALNNKWCGRIDVLDKPLIIPQAHFYYIESGKTK